MHDDIDIDHIQHILEKEDKTIRNFNRFMHGVGITKTEPKSEFESLELDLGIGERVSLTEFEEAVSVETDTSSSKQAKTTKDKTTKNQSILQHNKVNGFEKDIVNALSEESTL